MEKEDNKVEENNQVVETNNQAVESNQVIEENKKLEEKKSNNKKTTIILIILIVLLVIIGVLMVLNRDKIFKYYNSNNKTPLNEKEETQNEEVIESDVEQYKSEYTITKNSLDNFDLAFLKLENNKKNMIYSPLSIKYALGMLMNGANGETKKQINTVLGNYKFHKFDSNKNMSFANALFVKNTYKDSIKKSYIDSLMKNYNADVIYDSFETPNNVNNYISDKTFKILNGGVNDIKDYNFILLNALAIDMNWVHRIQSDSGEEDDSIFKDDSRFVVYFDHLKYDNYIDSLNVTDYHKLSFNSDGISRQSVQIGATINNYNIVKLLGKDKIKKIVTDDYNEWVKNGASWSENGAMEACSEICDDDENCKPDISFDFDEYLKELDSNYGYSKGSTDFEMYIDDEVKVFKKDLRKYNNKTLEYVGIMPTKQTLQEFIKNKNANDIYKLVKSTKKIESKNFKEGVITEIYGYIPLFNFNYELNLIDDLKKLGINDVFDSEKSDLSNLSDSKNYIDKVIHESKIEFTNDGIKAAAYTMAGGMGGGDCGYDYLFNPPVERIDLTFDKPFLFLIIDKDTEEVWFSGKVYDPDKYKSYKETLKKVHPEYFQNDYDEE